MAQLTSHHLGFSHTHTLATSLPLFCAIRCQLLSPFPPSAWLVPVAFRFRRLWLRPPQESKLTAAASLLTASLQQLLRRALQASLALSASSSTLGSALWRSAASAAAAAGAARGWTPAAVGATSRSPASPLSSAVLRRRLNNIMAAQAAAALSAPAPAPAPPPASAAAVPRQRHSTLAPASAGAAASKNSRHAVDPAPLHRPAVHAQSTLQLPVPDHIFHAARAELAALPPLQQAELYRHLRSDQAGEVGAVWIYRGAAAALKLRPQLAPRVQDFVHGHAETERGHLAFFVRLLPSSRRTYLAPGWRVAGFLLGFLPTLLGGAQGLFITVNAVETFVEEHYLAHIEPLRRQGQANPCPSLTAALLQFCSDEVLHADDAAVSAGVGHIQPEKLALLPWLWYQIVWHGSAGAAALARRL